MINRVRWILMVGFGCRLLFGTMEAPGAAGLLDFPKAGPGVKFFKSKSFYVTLDGDGTEKTIAKAGPFTMFATCAVDGDRSRITLNLTSDVDGWMTVRETTDIKMAVDIVIGTRGFNTAQSLFVNSVDEFVTMGPDQKGKLYYISWVGEINGLGSNVFEHDCISSGIVNIMLTK